MTKIDEQRKRDFILQAAISLPVELARRGIFYEEENPVSKIFDVAERLAEEAQRRGYFDVKDEWSHNHECDPDSNCVDGKVENEPL